jgi:50S ribosomal subunit-associated GTPase HflX
MEMILVTEFEILRRRERRGWSREEREKAGQAGQAGQGKRGVGEVKVRQQRRMGQRRVVKLGIGTEERIGKGRG